MATAKIQTVKGLRVEIFSRTLRKNITRPLTVWIVGTEIERDCFRRGNMLYLGQQAKWQVEIQKGDGNYGRYGEYPSYDRRIWT